MKTFEERVIEIVNNSQGIKGVDLSVKLASEYQEYSNNTILEKIFNLIEDGKLVEVEYELPTMSYRTKSFILPRGTSININKVKSR